MKHCTVYVLCEKQAKAINTSVFITNFQSVCFVHYLHSICYLLDLDKKWQETYKN